MTQEVDEEHFTLLHHFVLAINGEMRKLLTENINDPHYEIENLQPRFSNLLKILMALNPDELYLNRFFRSISDIAPVMASSGFASDTYLTCSTVEGASNVSKSSHALLFYVLVHGAAIRDYNIVELGKVVEKNIHAPLFQQARNALKVHALFKPHRNDITQRMVSIYIRNKIQLDALILQGSKNEIYFPDEILGEIVTQMTGLTSREFKLLSKHVLANYKTNVGLKR